MKIKSVTVGGFKNLTETKLSLNGITAIVSPNNYGKSNLLEAINFGTDFLSCSVKQRNSMMRYVRGIPINKAIANTEFVFEIEFEDDSLNEYRYVKYGYKFQWYKDDGSGQKITDEWIEARASESVRYTSYLKRKEGKYRKDKSTPSYRKINLDSSQLAIDVLLAIDDIDIHSVIRAIKAIDYHVCSSLDLKDRFLPEPIEYVGGKGDSEISFDDRDVPRALYKLKMKFPEKYDLFLEAVYTLFPEFDEVSVLPYELRKDSHSIKIFSAAPNEAFSEDIDAEKDSIPFKIRDELYRVLITHKDLNQSIDMSMMSTGTKRIFWLLANIFIASSGNISLVGVEELETSIHPRLLKNLLEILGEALEETSIIISSHSPYLVQYFKSDNIYVGMPTDDGTAVFKKVKTGKVKMLVNNARDLAMSVGEYLFELMSGDSDAAETLSFYLEA
ncbi:MAG: hypothetical protein E7442_02990 [Ruminococcaceae bacterium]|nr:hypothetical protein [Oscillospiraceae bacterium]